VGLDEQADYGGQDNRSWLDGSVVGDDFSYPADSLEGDVIPEAEGQPAA
jgi:hypothetical protein